jgi:F-box and leucine-rich repeat protein GRR1
VRVQKLTDIGIYALVEHAKQLEDLHISYCDGLSLDAIHLLLKEVGTLQHLVATGVLSLRRKGIKRFSDPAPSVRLTACYICCARYIFNSKGWDDDQQAAFRVFSGDNVARVGRFLDKEQGRLKEAESKNLKFVPRADDRLDLY